LYGWSQWPFDFSPPLIDTNWISTYTRSFHKMKRSLELNLKRRSVEKKKSCLGKILKTPETALLLWKPMIGFELRALFWALQSLSPKEKSNELSFSCNNVDTNFDSERQHSNFCKGASKAFSPAAQNFKWIYLDKAKKTQIFVS
jgi:hypothetical protein